MFKTDSQISRVLGSHRGRWDAAEDTAEEASKEEAEVAAAEEVAEQQ